MVNLAHALVLPGAVVVADDGPHPLHYAVGRQVEECLQLIIDAQHQNVHLGVSRQNGVQRRDQQGGQGQVQGGGDANGVQALGHVPPGPQVFPADAHLDGPQEVHRQVHSQGQRLADARGQGGALYAQGREGPQAENQHRVQQDVGHAAAQHAGHGGFHGAYGLEQLLKNQPQHNHDGKAKGHVGVPRAQANHRLGGGEHPQKGGHQGYAGHGQHHPVDQRQRQPLGGRPVRLVPLARPQVQGNHGVDAHPKSNAHRVDKVLDGEDQGEGRHGVLADLRHEKAVHNVVQGIYQHGKGHGQPH